MTVVEQPVTIRQPAGEDDEVHVHCCTDPTVMLCGEVDDGTMSVHDPRKPTSCVVCDDLEITAYWFCPVRARCIQDDDS